MPFTDHFFDYGLNLDLHILMKQLISAALLLASLPAMAEAPLWLRDTRISPSGETIAFTYRGDIFTVPTQGGKAHQLTSGAAYDSRPVWSPDGSRLVFRSNREGSDDIYVVDAEGGNPRRLTFNSDQETPLAFLNDSTLVFSTVGLPSAQSARAPFKFALPFTININEEISRPRVLMSVPMLSLDVDSRGRMLYTDKKGYENVFRKHERSSGTDDVWFVENGKFTKLTDFNGHDMDPVWAPSGDTFFFISEEDGTLNVYKRNLDGTSKTQLTRFERHPVRSLSAADNGTLAFSWDGEIYTLRDGAEPQKVNVEILADQYDSDRVKDFRTTGATSMAVSPSGEEVAFVIRGDVYVTSTKYKTTKRITDTPAQERNLSFSPDGRSIVFDSDRDGYWQLITVSLKNPEDKLFTYAVDLEEKPLYKCSTSAMQPIFSPDGKKVAFLENRNEVRVIDVKSGNVTTALPARYNYSYEDGDVPFDWSPDSEWLVATYLGDGGWNNMDVAAFKADGSEIIDLTESGFSDGAPKWALDGKGVTYVTSKYGMKSQGSWGNTSDIVLMGLDGEAWDEFFMSQEDAERRDEADKEKAENDRKDGKSDSKKTKDKRKDVKDAEKTKLDMADRRFRTSRLTDTSAIILDYYMAPKGDKLYYVAQQATGDLSLLEKDLRKGDTRVLAKGVAGGLEADAKGENLFVLGDGIQRVDLSTGEVKPVEFEAPYGRHPSLEREYMYSHMLRQVNDKFYDSKLHGVDWEYYGEHYRRFLPHISNDRDFADLLSEILGELNASHTGGRAGAGTPSLETASLGAFFDPDYTGEGLKVVEIMRRGPLSMKKANVEAGDVILAIDGDTIRAGKDISPLLEGKAGRKTRLTVRKADGRTVSGIVKPVSKDYENTLRYQRWVEHNEQVVDSVSGGRVGYVHVQNMDSPSYRTAYERILGKYRNCDAVIVDTRYNGGGWLHNDLALLLSGKEYVKFTPRGQYIGSEPFSQWTKPNCLLVNECNYSDGMGSAYTYQTLGLGDIIGAPIPGTMTAVWWERQINPEIVFGIPQVTCEDMQGTPLENHQINPDMVIYNDPADLERGIDTQLIEATRLMMGKSAK